MTYEAIINMFIAGKREGHSTLGDKPGHLKISGDKLIHYNTTVAERTDKGYILNRSKYSIQTNKLENRLSYILPDYIIASNVPQDYSGSLIPFVNDGQDETRIKKFRSK